MDDAPFTTTNSAHRFYLGQEVSPVPKRNGGLQTKNGN